MKVEVPNNRYKQDVMYKVPEEWNAAMVDWYQLGVLIYYCIQETQEKSDTKYHEMELNET